MSDYLIQTAEDIDDRLLFYIENEANSLSSRDKLAIDNYVDRELFNPSMESFLGREEVASSLLPHGVELEALSLSHVQEIREQFHLPEWLRIRFRQLKRKIKKIFCKIVAELGDELDWKKIIKAVLLALIPAFAGGVPALAAPIVIGLIAYLIKYGLSQTCPA
jgi:hypothetical protein